MRSLCRSVRVRLFFLILERQLANVHMNYPTLGTRACQFGLVRALLFFFILERQLANVRMNKPYSTGLWRHPDNRSQNYKDLDYWLDLARFLDEEKFHGLFIADMLGVYDVYKGPGNIDPVLPGAAQFPISDPL